MTDHSGFADLIRETSENIAQADARSSKRFEAIENSISELFLKTTRPGFSGGGNDSADFERKDARELCILKHSLDVPKDDGHLPIYEPSSSEVDNAMIQRTALRSLFRHGNVDHLDGLEKKALTSFSFGTNSFILPPAISDRVLSCLFEPDDITALVDVQTISAPSIRFFIDNGRIDEAGWACDSSCFANNLNPDLREEHGLGELEIKAETLRYVCCVGERCYRTRHSASKNGCFRKCPRASSEPLPARS